jgi:hypothetical protein
MSETTRGVGSCLHTNDILWISVTTIAPFAGYTRTIVKSLLSSVRGAFGQLPHVYTLLHTKGTRAWTSFGHIAGK